MSDANHVDVPRSALGQIRGFLVGILVGVVFLVGAAVRTEMAARDAHGAAEAVKVETEKADAARCASTLLTRAGSLEKDIRIFTRLGHEMGAPQDRIDEFLEGIRQDYEDLPIPSDCPDT